MKPSSQQPRTKADLIVMSSQGRSGISKLLIGSVTNKVLTRAKTPVLVCH
jgi:nucleotide-binding universal stress UspA family protein